MKNHSEQKMYGSYKQLGVELFIDFVIMYLVMYTMIATLDHFCLNVNNVYMTLMMVAPTAIVMLISMRSMFPSARLNLAIGNEQFLRSMIPHHSGAILMCEQSAITDPQISALCDQAYGVRFA